MNTDNFDEGLIRKIAALASVELASNELLELVSQLTKVVEYVAKLQTIDTLSVNPMSHATAISCLLRDDIPETSVLEGALLNAPEQNSGYFCVPRIIDG